LKQVAEQVHQSNVNLDVRIEICFNFKGRLHKQNKIAFHKFLIDLKIHDIALVNQIVNPSELFTRYYTGFAFASGIQSFDYKI